MPFPVDVNALGSVSGSQTLAAAGHATRHNEVKTALEGIRDALGGTAVPSGTVQPILAAGSASAPSLSFTGDSNTGLWSPAADTVAASTGGTERMRIDSSGNVGIGTTSPTVGLELGGAVGGASQIRLKPASNTVDLRLNPNYGSADLPSLSVVSNHPLAFHTNNTERMRIDTAGLITGSGTSLGAWTAYTPTLAGTGWAIGNGTVAGRYCQIGKIVHFTGSVTFGSTSTFGGSALTISLPVTRVAATGSPIAVRLRDDSAAKAYLGTAVLTSGATTFSPESQVASTTGELSNLISTVPFTWATSDSILFSGTYEIA